MTTIARPLAIFVECVDNIHAGVEMELISGGYGHDTARAVLRSTLDRRVVRVPNRCIRALALMSEDEIDDVFLAECECEVIYPTDERN